MNPQKPKELPTCSRIYFSARNVFDDSDVHDMDHVRDMTAELMTKVKTCETKREWILKIDSLSCEL